MQRDVRHLSRSGVFFFGVELIGAWKVSWCEGLLNAIVVFLPG